MIEVGDTNYKGRIYPSEEAYLNEHELENNLKNIRNFISYNELKLSLNQTREILKILKDS